VWPKASEQLENRLVSEVITHMGDRKASARHIGEFMDDLAKLMDAIHAVYGAPGAPEGWSRALGNTTGLVGGAAAVYLRINREDLSTEASGMVGFTEEDALAYVGAQAAKKDIRLSYLHNLIPGDVFREFEYVTDREAYNRSEWIQYQLERHGVYWCLSAHVSRGGLWNDYLSINGLKSRGSFSDQEKALVCTMLPHYERAAELDRLVNGLQSRYGAVLSVLDHFLVGLVIVDGKGNRIVDNLAARRTAAETGAFSLRASRIRLTDSDTDLAFQRILAAVLSTMQKAGQSEGGQLLVAKSNGGNPLLLELMPIRDDGCSDGSNIQGCAVFIMDPDRSQFLSVQGIATIFGLTDAEKVVAGLLINGRTLREIADEREVSFETTRSQLKSIFSKTGTSSQPELVRMAAKANPPISDRRNTCDD